MKGRRNSTRDEWMSLHAAAAALGLSRETALALCIKGDLVGQHIAGRTVVSRASVEAVRDAKAAEDAAA
jgi:hypothetical protein